jgi:uncharacterized protein HemX
MEPTPQQKNKKEVEEFSGMFGITLVIVLIVAGGIYFLYTQQQKMEQERQFLQEQTNS